MPSIDRKVFEENLLLTQQYCSLQLNNTHLNPAQILRSYNPDINGQSLFSYKVSNYKNFYWNTAEWLVDPLDKNELYKSLFNEQMIHKRLVAGTSPKLTSEGKILFVEMDTTTYDGASESATDGFIDINDWPPIDTWFYLSSINNRWNTAVAFAWIPEPFTKYAEEGINVNTTNSFRWLEDTTLADYNLFFEDELPNHKHIVHAKKQSKFRQALEWLFPWLIK
ncbi:hypothetical protein GCM10027037_30570 [Mucilaginibacter koreensis]